MQVEYEATFCRIDKDDVRVRLKTAGARLVSPEFLMKRVVFNLPSGHEIAGGWVRVRQEDGRMTMSIKVVNGDRIQDQHETQVEVDDFGQAVNLLTELGCTQKAIQETKRERWLLDGVDIAIDEWPFLEPFVEVEGTSEAVVRSAVGKLGFDYASAQFCSVDTLYAEKYGIAERVVNMQTPKLVFGMQNPFVR